MRMKIKYETKPFGKINVCVTPCPFNRVLGKDNHIIKVGSHYCTQCPHCLSKDAIEKYVLCSNKVKTIIKKL